MKLICYFMQKEINMTKFYDKTAQGWVILTDVEQPMHIADLIKKLQYLQKEQPDSKVRIRHYATHFEYAGLDVFKEF